MQTENRSAVPWSFYIPCLAPPPVRQLTDGPSSSEEGSSSKTPLLIQEGWPRTFGAPGSLQAEAPKCTNSRADLAGRQRGPERPSCPAGPRPAPREKRGGAMPRLDERSEWAYDGPAGEPRSVLPESQSRAPRPPPSGALARPARRRRPAVRCAGGTWRVCAEGSGGAGREVWRPGRRCLRNR